MPLRPLGRDGVLMIQGHSLSRACLAVLADYTRTEGRRKLTNRQEGSPSRAIDAYVTRDHI